MKDFAEINLKKENQISTPLRKGTGRGILFPLFSFFFPHFPPTLKGGEKYLPNVAKEIFSFSRD
jgi:hypothetical protein